MTARITAYTYVHDGATDHGSTHPPYNATATLGVIEQPSSPTVTYVRPTTPLPFYLPGGTGDQLTAWQDALDSYAPAGYYTITYSPTTRRVTIASTNATSFRPVMVADGATWTGFTQDLSAGWATSWTGDDAPAAICELLGATVEPAEDAARVDLHEYRHGRAVAVVWGNHQLHRVTLYFRGDDAHVLDPGYLVTGRVKIQQGSDTTAYSPTNVDGVIDGFVVASMDPAEDGDLGEVWSLTLLVAVPRG